MEEDEGKEETEASSQGKAEAKAEGEEKETKEGEEGAAAGKSDDKEGKKDTDMVKQNEVSLILGVVAILFSCLSFKVSVLHVGISMALEGHSGSTIVILLANIERVFD